MRTEVGAVVSLREDRSMNPSPSLEISDVWLVYGSKSRPVTAIADINFNVNAGEFVALLGPSGCGKSTLLSVVAGLDRPTRGHVSLHGKEVLGPPPDLGMVFQRDLLLEWRTAIDNVLMPFEIRGEPVTGHRERATSLLEMVGLKSFVNAYPWQMSGGMRQRVSICRALVRSPEILLMDEPFGAVDALSREELDIQLSALCSRKGRQPTVLFVTHDIEEAVFLANRVLVFSQHPGRIVADKVVDEPRPRQPSFRESSRFREFVLGLRGILREQGVLSR
ncbi:MAG: ABC transporter ATP-binding protein [Planctomycetota bacterium]